MREASSGSASIAGHHNDCEKVNGRGACNCISLYRRKGEGAADEDDEMTDAYRQVFDPDWNS